MSLSAIGLANIRRCEGCEHWLARRTSNCPLCDADPKNIRSLTREFLETGKCPLGKPAVPVDMEAEAAANKARLEASRQKREVAGAGAIIFRAASSYGFKTEPEVAAFVQKFRADETGANGILAESAATIVERTCDLLKITTAARA